jgi:hypothetical protein
MYPEDFYDVISTTPSQSSLHSPDLVILNKVIEFAKAHNLKELKQRSRKLREFLKRCFKEGGPSGFKMFKFSTQNKIPGLIPSISRLSFALTNYDPLLALESGTFYFTSKR